MSGPFNLIYTPAASNWNSKIGHLVTSGGHIVYLWPELALFAPERSKSANVATRDTNKLSICPPKVMWLSLL